MPGVNYLNVYILSYGTNSDTFSLSPHAAVLSLHRSQGTAQAAGRAFITSTLNAQCIQSFEQREGRKPNAEELQAEIEEDWHADREQEWKDKKGKFEKWKSMINAKEGGRDLTVLVECCPVDL